MNDFDAVFDAGIHFVERDDIFGVMVAELHQVPHLAVGRFGDLDADLHVNALVAARGDKVDLLGIVLADEDIVAAALQFEEHDVLHRAVQHFAVIAQQRVFQGDVGKVILLLRFQDTLALQVVAFAGVDDKCLLQPAQIVVDALHRDLAVLAFEEGGDRVCREGLAHILNDTQKSSDIQQVFKV